MLVLEEEEDPTMLVLLADGKKLDALERNRHALAVFDSAKHVPTHPQ